MILIISGIINFPDNRAKKNRFSSGYVFQSGDPLINVNGNSALAAIADSGDGTFFTPYIIEDRVFVANGTQYAINIQNTDDYVLIRNCIIESTSSRGISINNCSNVGLHDNMVKNKTEYGIYFRNSDDCTVHGNDVANGAGIQVEYSNNMSLSQNVVRNTTTPGIYFYHSDNNTIWGNFVSNASYFCIFLHTSHYNTIVWNLVSRSYDADFFYDDQDRSGGIGLRYSMFNQVIANNASSHPDRGYPHVGSAIYLADSANDNSIVRNLITSSITAIWSQFSDRVTISNNSIFGGVLKVGTGVDITILWNEISNGYIRVSPYMFERPSNVIIKNNTVRYGTSIGGIQCVEADNAEISGNTVSNAYGDGFSILKVTNYTISHNIASHCKGYGIRISGSNVTIIRNSFHYNEKGCISFDGYNPSTDIVIIDNICEGIVFGITEWLIIISACAGITIFILILFRYQRNKKKRLERSSSSPKPVFRP
jgi:parallel beta-helix repeat protein